MELLEPAPGPGNVARVAAGGADFCLTSVAHYLRARATAGDLPARFAAVVVRRSPMSALVAADSPLARPDDLPGRRLGGPPDGGLVAEYQAFLTWLGLGASVVVPMDYADAPRALATGEADAVADFVDLLPRVRRQAGIPVRAIPFGLDVYASGLVAADRVPAELVARMREAIVAALEHQRHDPESGVEALCRRYPDVDPAEALEGWSLVEPNVFTGDVPGSMDAERWKDTIRFFAGAHGHRLPPPATVYRPDFADLAVG